MGSDRVIISYTQKIVMTITTDCSDFLPPNQRHCHFERDEPELFFSCFLPYFPRQLIENSFSVRQALGSAPDDDWALPIKCARRISSFRC